MRRAFPLIAMATLFVTAASVAAIGGVIATGIGGQPMDRPEGLVARVDTADNDTALVIEHPDGAVPSPDRVFVVDDDGARVSWNDSRIDPGVARIAGGGTLGCPRQGATYRVVFEGRSRTDTLLTYQVDAPIPASAVQRCEAAG